MQGTQQHCHPCKGTQQHCHPCKGIQQHCHPERSRRISAGLKRFFTYVQNDKECRHIATLSSLQRHTAKLSSWAKPKDLSRPQEILHIRSEWQGV